MSPIAAALRDLERKRLRALVAADEVTLEALHAPEFVLIHPGGGAWPRGRYLNDVLTGAVNYRRFEAVSEIQVIADGGLAVLRYRSAIDIHVRGREAGPLECWHTDCYRTTGDGAQWQVVWSQATEIQPGPWNDERTAPTTKPALPRGTPATSHYDELTCCRTPSALRPGNSRDSANGYQRSDTAAHLP